MKIGGERHRKTASMGVDDRGKQLAQGCSVEVGEELILEDLLSP